MYYIVREKKGGGSSSNLKIRSRGLLHWSGFRAHKTCDCAILLLFADWCHPPFFCALPTESRRDLVARKSDDRRKTWKRRQ